MVDASGVAADYSPEVGAVGNDSARYVDCDFVISSSRNVGEDLSEECRVALKARQVSDVGGGIEGNVHGGAVSRCQRDSIDGHGKRENGGARRRHERDSGESQAHGGCSTTAAAVEGAARFGAAAGSQGQGGEQENRKKRKRFAAIHVAPHDKLVCARPLERKTLKISVAECNAVGEREGTVKAACSVLKRPESRDTRSSRQGWAADGTKAKGMLS